MAAPVDALTLVLEADTQGFQQGMKRAQKSAKDLQEDQNALAFQNGVLLASLESLTSGLNGLVGGYSKTINAARDMNIINEQQYEGLLQTQKQMELLIGPVEMVISTFKIFNAVLLMNPIILIVMAIIALVVVLVLIEKETGIFIGTLRSMNDVFQAMIMDIKGIGDGLEGLTSKFEIFGDIGDKISGYVGSIT